MIARLLRSADFERVLRSRHVARTAHFAVHHVADRPTRGSRAMTGDLSTAGNPAIETSVDDSSSAAPPAHAKGSIWLGAVVPKRHARRAVMRNLLKRQIRAAVADHVGGLDDGLWVVRLRAPVEPRFVSAASDALRKQSRGELDRLLSAAALAVRAPAS